MGFVSDGFKVLGTADATNKGNFHRKAAKAAEERKGLKMKG
jgi:hypothetical protein